MSKDTKDRSVLTMVLIFAILMLLGLIAIWTNMLDVFGSRIVPDTVAL